MKTYIGELTKLTVDNIDSLTKLTDEDKVLLFCKKGENISVELCKAISDKRMNMDIITADTPEEMCFYLGRYVSEKTELISAINIPASVKKLILPQDKPKRTTRKATGKKAVSPKEKEDKTMDKKPACSTRKKTETKAVHMPEPEPETEEQEAEADIWLDNESEGFYMRMCKYSEKDRDTILPETAKIFAQSSNVNDGLKKIKLRYGKTVADEIAKNANLLMAAIKNGYNKKVEKIEY